MSGTLFVINPDDTQTELRWEKSGPPDLATLQAAVGGYIERVKVKFNGMTRDAYVNEDGLSEGLAYNRFGTKLTRGTIFEGVTLVGPVVVWVPTPKKMSKKS